MDNLQGNPADVNDADTAPLGPPPELEKPAQPAQESDSGLSDRAKIKAAKPQGDVTVDTFWAAIHWLKELVKGGWLSERKAQNHITGLKMLGGIMEDNGEDITVANVTANLNHLPTRWARKNPGRDGGTGNTYKSNAKWLLDNYTEWCRDPGKFDTSSLGGRAPKSNGGSNGSANGSTPPAKRVPVPRKKKTTNDSHQIICSLGEAGNVHIHLPVSPQEMTIDHLSLIACQLATMLPGFNMRAAAIIASHLATRTPDFDPMQSIGDQLFRPLAPPKQGHLPNM